jgi:hypothetical protein
MRLVPYQGGTFYRHCQPGGSVFSPFFVMAIRAIAPVAIDPAGAGAVVDFAVSHAAGTGADFDLDFAALEGAPLDFPFPVIAFDFTDVVDAEGGGDLDCGAFADPVMPAVFIVVIVCMGSHDGGGEGQ